MYMKYLLLTLILCNISVADEVLKEEIVTFEKNIRPIFQSHCISCHPGSVNYSVAYKQRDKIFKKVVRLREMPPKYATRPNENEIELIRKWIENGAKR